jgi:hypothetical protein
MMLLMLPYHSEQLAFAQPVCQLGCQQGCLLRKRCKHVNECINAPHSHKGLLVHAETENQGNLAPTYTQGQVTRPTNTHDTTTKQEDECMIQNSTCVRCADPCCTECGLLLSNSSMSPERFHPMHYITLVQRPAITFTSPPTATYDQIRTHRVWTHNT